MNIAAAENLPTGFDSLDSALGGGIPRGSIVEIYGPPDCGKTALALQIAAHAQQDALVAAWVDADRSFDPAFAARLGVIVESMPVMRPDSAEHAIAMVHQLARSRALDLVVVDSAAALVPELELEAGVGTQSPGLHSRVLSSGLRTLRRLLRTAAITVVFLNQTRVRKNRAGEDVEGSASGPALKLHAAIRIALTSPNGDRTAFRIEKNKVAQSFVCGELVRANGPGFTKAL